MPQAQRWTRWGAALVFAIISIASPLHAQYFGQNQVQYDRLRWRVIETEHFQIHYYPQIADVARCGPYGRTVVRAALAAHGTPVP